MYLEQRKSAEKVIFVIAERHRNRFAYGLKSGKVDYRIDGLVRLKDEAQVFLIPEQSCSKGHAMVSLAFGALLKQESVHLKSTL